MGVVERRILSVLIWVVVRVLYKVFRPCRCQMAVREVLGRVLGVELRRRGRWRGSLVQMRGKLRVRIRAGIKVVAVRVVVCRLALCQKNLTLLTKHI